MVGPVALQTRYMLGDNGAHSYVVGFGKEYPTYVQSMGASCPGTPTKPIVRPQLLTVILTLNPSTSPTFYLRLIHGRLLLGDPVATPRAPPDIDPDPRLLLQQPTTHPCSSKLSSCWLRTHRASVQPGPNPMLDRTTV